MNEFEKQLLRLENTRREFLSVPAWARAEQLERSLPLAKIWKGFPKENTLHKLFRLRSGK